MNKKSKKREAYALLLTKLSRIMRLMTLMLILGINSLLAATGYSQSTRLTLKMVDTRIEDVLNQIESKSEFYFLFNQKQVDVNRKVSIDATEETISEILDELFAGMDVKHLVIDRQIILTPVSQIETSAPLTGIQNQQQEKKITGKVTDQSGAPIPGATVVVKGTTTGTITDADGKFTLSIPSDANTLSFSFVGMKTQEVSVAGKTSINVVLAEETIGLDEVVAIGYGTQKKVNLTGAVVAIKGSDLTQSPSINVSNSLVGRLPGVIANNRSGMPGSDGSSILIRGRSTTGNNAPLIVIDGVPDRGNIDHIDAYDIESISVLKDASAAIYGSRAANGVILVTTKRGKIGKPTINYNFNEGFVEFTKTPKPLDSYQFAKAMNELSVNDGGQLIYSPEVVQKFKDGSDPISYPSTNFMKEMLNRFSTQYQQNLSVSGGTEIVRYHVSLGSQNQNGIDKNSTLKYKQYSLVSNIDAKITESIKVGFDIKLRQEDTHNPYSTGGNAMWSPLPGGLYHQVPTYNIKYPNGLYAANGQNGNMVLNYSDISGYSDITRDIFNSKFTFEVKIPWIEGLSIDGYLAADRNSDFVKISHKPYIVYTFNKTTLNYDKVVGGGILLPDLSEQSTYSTSITPNIRASYNRTFGKHQINSFIAYEQNDSRGNNFSAYRKNFLSGAIDELFAGDDAGQSTNGSAWESSRRNYFSRLGYSFADKYLFDFNFRVDGSYIFPKNKRYGFFPGVSAAWRLSKEEFFKNFRFIDNLKLRASYGEMGNDQVDAFQYLSTFSYGGGFVSGDPVVLNKTVVPNVVPNPNITWEVAKTTNLGLDAGFWDSLLGIEFDMFYTKRSNILAFRNASVPTFTGISLPAENIGSVENKGFEIVLNHKNRINDVTYGVSANMSFARNKILFIDEAPNKLEYQKLTGHPIGSLLYYNVTGIFQSQEQLDSYPHQPNAKVGDFIYQDYNGDKVIDANDKTFDTRTITPEVIFGIQLNASWKRIDFSMNWQGQTRSSTKIYPIVILGSNLSQDWYDQSWRPDNKSARLPALRDWNRYNVGDNNGFLFDATYIRLKTVEIGYTLSPKLLSKLKISNVRVNLSGFNLLTFDKTGFSSYDPEMADYYGSTYPQQKIYNIGLNITF